MERDILTQSPALRPPTPPPHRRPTRPPRLTRARRPPRHRVIPPPPLTRARRPLWYRRTRPPRRRARRCRRTSSSVRRDTASTGHCVGAHGGRARVRGIARRRHAPASGALLRRPGRSRGGPRCRGRTRFRPARAHRRACRHRLVRARRRPARSHRLARSRRPAPSAGPSAAFTRPALAGRAAELAAVEEALGQVAGGRPGFLLITGEPGVGKTRLAEEAVARAQARGFEVAVGRCAAIEGAPAFWPWTTLLERLTAALPAVPADVRDDLPGAGMGERADPEGARFRAYRATAEVLSAASARGRSPSPWTTCSGRTTPRCGCSPTWPRS
ncbi:AAA family ATPase [Nonomuraea thailandensis]